MNTGGGKQSGIFFLDMAYDDIQHDVHEFRIKEIARARDAGIQKYVAVVGNNVFENFVPTIDFIDVFNERGAISVMDDMFGELQSYDGVDGRVGNDEHCQCIIFHVHIRAEKDGIVFIADIFAAEAIKADFFAVCFKFFGFYVFLCHGNSSCIGKSNHCDSYIIQEDIGEYKEKMKTTLQRAYFYFTGSAYDG